MIGAAALLNQLRSDDRGSVVIETAFVVPILAVLALGGFEASRIVSRQVELQTAASEAAAIVLANPPDEAAERSTIESVIESSTELAANKVTLALRYRCGSAVSLVETSEECAETDVISEFVLVTMADTYTPIWTGFGIGSPLNYRVKRRVQIS